MPSPELIHSRRVPMDVIPVMDLRGGVVVRAIAGRRAEYRPLTSPLCPSSDPVDVAQRLTAASGSKRLYLADLDAILASPSEWNVDLYLALQQLGMSLSVDAGLREPRDMEHEDVVGIAEWIVGLETWQQPETLPQLVEMYGSARQRFSLDLQAGRLLAGPAWQDAPPLTIVERVIAAGFTRLLVLDLADVGVNAGNRHAELLATIRRQYPQINLWAGGGVRDASDLTRLADIGVDGVLVASALHDKRLVTMND